MPKITVARALTAHLGKRLINLATLIALGIFGLIFILTAALVYFFSPWWWLLIIPFVFLLSIFFVVRLFVVLIIRRIHPDHMNKEQKRGLDDFSDKVQAAIEARATPLPVIVLISVKDLVFHRDITTIKKLISDTAGLRSDYANLEKLF